MPQIAQQDYKVIAPKEGRSVKFDAAALVELKKAIIAGIAFDCLIKDTLEIDGDINRVLGFYPDGDSVACYSHANDEIIVIDLPNTVAQYQGLAAVQNAEDEKIGLQHELPMLTAGMAGADGYLGADNASVVICVDGKYLTVTDTGSRTIEALAIAESGPTEDFINITWEDAQKLIGLPLI